MKKKKATKKNNNAGYALIGMMSVMMFALILTTAAAPRLKSESQREKEEEMLWRGQQVATAINKFYAARGTFPRDLKDLVKGIDIGTKKMRFLRPSALCDPMMPCTPGESNWRAVNPGDPLVKELYDAYQDSIKKLTIDGKVAVGRVGVPPLLQAQAMLSSKQLPTGLGLGSNDSAPPGGGEINPTGGDDKTEDGKLKAAPIVGVVSRKSGKMFRIYYGIEEYEKTLFFPGVNVIVSGFLNPLIFAAQQPLRAANSDPNCPQGGVFIDGKCWGNLVDGQCPPSKRGPNGACTQ